MKNYIFFIVQFVLALCISGVALAGAPTVFGTGIVGSVHDFSRASWNPGSSSYTGEICNVCHAPHDGGRDTYKAGLLWNRRLSSATYIMYDNSWSPGITHAQDSQPTGNSKLCLSCHDGSLALDAFGSYTGTGWRMWDENTNKVIPRFKDATGRLDMHGTHPISVTYAAPGGGTAKGFNPATNTWPGGLTIADTLQNGKVQCSTCHDVHDTPGEVVPGTQLLRAGLTAAQGGASALCLTCHDK